MTADHALDPPRHLRSREGGEQSITFVELFFDLVYVFAVTQISHVLIEHLDFAGAGRAAFLLLVIWWAWIYTTWMVNWFDPDSPPVRVALLGVMGASLLLAAALPEAFGKHGALFVIAYVGLQVGRNATAAALLPRTTVLRRTFERITVWSVASGALWFGGLLESGDRRLVWWLPALAVELLAPAVGYVTPLLGRSRTGDYDIEGGHFAERCQGFIIIALGESIVVTGATAASAGLDNTVVLALLVAFLETAALWWLYFGQGAAHSRRRIASSDDAGRLARDAYTYLHLPIVAGIVAVAVGDDLLIADARHSLSRAGAIMVLGGPALYLLGESIFRLRMIGSVSPKRIGTVIVLCALLVLSPYVTALGLSLIVALVLTALAIWEGQGGRRPAPVEPVQGGAVSG
jgi:low temperature requirement protein LtrA